MNGYNFTERVRKVLAMAREEAARLHHEYVGDRSTFFWASFARARELRPLCCKISTSISTTSRRRLRRR